MCHFRFVQILDVVYGMPVVMLLEGYHIPTMLEGLSNGAIYCLAKPLRPYNAKNLWCYALPKERESLEESSGSNDIDEESEMAEAEEIRALPVANNNPMALPPPLEWSQNLQSRYFSDMSNLGVADATPSELAHRINASRIRIENVTETLQAPIQAPTANAGQRLLSPGPGHSTSTPVVTLALPAARPLVEDVVENDGQLQHVPTASPLLDPTAFPSASSAEGEGDGEGTSAPPDESFVERSMDGPF